MKGYYLAIAVAMAATMSIGCRQSVQAQEQVMQSEKNVNIEKTASQSEAQETGKVYPAGEDVRYMDGWDDNKELTDEGLTKELIASYWYNEATDFKSCEKLADEIMEEAKNPGLGVRKLHEEGFTGKGVNVAIIDQPIALEHPEYKGKIVEYKNLCGEDSNESSMHGPAVTSILAGNTTGVAPDVNIYYVAAPSWTCDAAYQADALNWLIEKNKTLPKDKKIKAVSVSAAPSGKDSPFDKNNEQWDKAVTAAAKEGIFVFDCTQRIDVIGCYLEGTDREDPMCYKSGFGKTAPVTIGEDTLLLPVAPRTTAETYKIGSYTYQYGGEGGLSWGIPYAVGTMALGWQIKPDLTGEEMVKLLFDTAAINKDGNKVINPVAFVAAVQEQK